MALYSLQDIARTGLAPTYAAVAASDTFQNNGAVLLHIKNTGGSPSNVTVTVATQVDGQVATPRVVSIPATTGDKMIGPFPPELYNDPNTGLCTVNYSVTASVTAAAIRLPRT